MRSRATGRSMAVGTAFVGGTSLALAPLRVFLLDAEDFFGGKSRMGRFWNRSFGEDTVSQRVGFGPLFLENGRHICL